MSWNKRNNRNNMHGATIKIAHVSNIKLTCAFIGIILKKLIYPFCYRSFFSGDKVAEA
jgi:hypothetical protein